MRVKCPCCGATIDPFTAELVASLMPPTMGQIVRKLAMHPGQYVSSTEVAGYVWGNTPTGGPDHARTSINNSVTSNRFRLKALGYDIETKLGQSGGYMLKAAA